MQRLVKLVMMCSMLWLLAACAPAAPTRSDAPPAYGQNPLDQRAPAPVIGDASAPDTRCKVDADCTVKNVGNCCGYYPACVNVAAKVDPAAVAEQCRKTGTASVCGFPAINACHCDGGQCRADSRAKL